MKSTKSGRKWAHLSCVLWIPGASIGCANKMEPITIKIPVSRWHFSINQAYQWGAKKHNLLKNTRRSIHAVKIYTKQYSYFSIINQS